MNLALILKEEIVFDSRAGKALAMLIAETIIGLAKRQGRLQ